MNVFEECIKCQKDFSYFAENYIKILHPIRGIIPYSLYDYQKRLVKTYDDNRFMIVKKFRCGGFSTLTAIYGLWQCMFHHDRKFLFISKSDREAIDLGKIVSHAIEYLPNYLRPFLTQNNQHEKQFQCTNSKMWFRTWQAGRGLALTHLIIDEAAFIPQMEYHWKALWPTISTGGKCFVVSTVNGIGNWFQETYTAAVEKRNDFHVFDCSYKEHPDYNNEKWVTEMKKSLGERGWMQEIEGCFIGSNPTPQDNLRYDLRLIVDDPNLDYNSLGKIANAFENYKRERFEDCKTEYHGMAHSGGESNIRSI